MTADPSPTVTAAVEVMVNGRPATVESGETIADLLVALDRDPLLVAIEMNGTIVSRGDFPSVVLGAGDRLEIVQFVQGG